MIKFNIIRLYVILYNINIQIITLKTILGMILRNKQQLKCCFVSDLFIIYINPDSPFYLV